MSQLMPAPFRQAKIASELVALVDRFAIEGYYDLLLPGSLSARAGSAADRALLASLGLPVGDANIVLEAKVRGGAWEELRPLIANLFNVLGAISEMPGGHLVACAIPPHLGVDMTGLPQTFCLILRAA